MKNECSIIKDILPLYLENMVSSDTVEFVEKHISGCEDCKKELEAMRSEIPLKERYQEEDTAVGVIKNIKGYINKNRIFTGVISAIISAIIVILSFGYLTAPNYIQYTDLADTLVIEETEGVVRLSFAGEYELSQSELGVYDMSIYNTLWNEFFGIKKEQTIIINPNGEDIKNIYYISKEEGNGEISVIYGENPIPDGRMLSIPRVFLNYYFIIAVFVGFIVLVVLFIARKSRKAKSIALRLLFAPLSYIISHIMIMGFNGISYSATRDLYLILIVTILIYCLSYIMHKKLENNYISRIIK